MYACVDYNHQRKRVGILYIRNGIQVIQSLCRVGMRPIVTSTRHIDAYTMYNTIIQHIYISM